MDSERRPLRDGQPNFGRSYATGDVAQATKNQQDSTNGSIWRISKSRVYLFLSKPNSSRGAAIWNVFINLMILFSIATFCISTLPDFYSEDITEPWYTFELISLIVFGLEYFVRLFTCPDKKRFAKKFFNVVDLITVIAIASEILLPSVGSKFSFLRVIRLIRLFRLLSTSRYSDILMVVVRTFIVSRHMLFVMIIVFGIEVTVFSSLQYIAERGEWDENLQQWNQDGEKSDFQTILGTFYWCIITMATVGYGDAYPKTLVGKLIGSATIVFGVISIAFPVASIGANFTREYNQLHTQKSEKTINEVESASASEESVILPRQLTMKEKIFQFLEDPTSSPGAQKFGLFIIMTIVASIVTFVVENQPAYYSKDSTMPWYAFEIVIVSIFTIEYFLRLGTAPNPLQYSKGFLNVIDLLSILPFYIELATSSDSESLEFLQLLRLLRVFRVFRLGKYSKGFQVVMKTLSHAKEPLGLLLMMFMLLVVIFSTLIYFAERGDYIDGNFCRNHVEGICEKSPYSSIIASFWWSVVTMTTVGYGDITPITNTGKLIACIAALSGVIAIAFPVTVLGNVFAEEWNKAFPSEDSLSSSETADVDRQKSEGDSLKDRIFNTLSTPYYSRTAYFVNMFVFSLITISVFTFCYSSTLDDDSSAPTGIKTLEAVFAICFTIDVLLRIACAPDPLRYCFGYFTIIDVLAVIPFYLKLFISQEVELLSLLRIFRLLRVFRMVRYSRIYVSFQAVIKTLRRSVDSLFLLVFLMTVEVILFSSYIFYAERGEFDEEKNEWINNGTRSDYQSILESAWWAIVTVTTVGYGDIFPTETAGKIIASLAAICGVLSISFPVTIVSNTFASEWRKSFTEQAKLIDRIRESNPGLMKRDRFYERIPDYGLMDWRQKLCKIFETPTEFDEKIINVILQLFALASVVIAMLSAEVSYQDKSERILLQEIQAFFMIASATEIFLRFFCAKSYLDFIKSPINLIDVLCCAIYIADLSTQERIHGLLVIRCVHVFRLFIIFPDTRYAKDFLCIAETLWSAVDAIILLFTLLGINIVFLSAIIWYLERGSWEDGAWRRDDGSQSPFQTIPDTFWWAIVTMSTVGYGDITPITVEGKCMAALVMLSGTLTLAFPVAIISANFGDNYEVLDEGSADIEFTPIQSPASINRQD